MSTAYDKHRETQRRRGKAASEEGRDVAPLPAVVHPDRKAAAERNLRLFCETYFPETFQLAWSDDHLKVIAKIERSTLEGGLFAMAMPRGSGKTTLAEVACLWAILFGHQPFVVLIGASEAHAEEMLDSIKGELEQSEILLDDFPEAAHPVQSLENIVQRSAGQTFNGVSTNISWKARSIVLPTIPGSKASGAIVKAAGITGRIRGMKFKRSDGRSVRPSLVIVDDPQTDESAGSVTQSAYRAAVVAGAILGLAGPGKKIAGVMPCTVIRPDDMADQILNRDKHPEWNGERTKLVYAFPTNEKLWDRYRELRNDGLRAGDGGAAATEFYREHRVEMDAGSRVAWAERHNPDELSAIQSAMNLRFQDERAFFAEYQNEPLPDVIADADELTVDVVAQKTNGLKRREFPARCDHLAAFIDVQKECLFWVVTAWESDFTGYIVDYGAFPDQKRAYFSLRDVRNTLSRAYPSMALEGRLYAGMESLGELLLGKTWRRDDGAEMRVSKCLVDANWGDSTHVVKKFCRQSTHSAVLLPSHGHYDGAAKPSVDAWPKKEGEQRGMHLRIRRGNDQVRQVVWGTNYWKSFVARALRTAQGDAGCLSLWGGKIPAEHLLFAEHCTAEFSVRTSGRGREVDEWQLRPGRDNHWWDGVVGCAVAASILGCQAGGAVMAAEPAKKRIKLSELQARKR